MASTASASAVREGWYLGRSALLHRADLSPWAFASEAFQADPRPVAIARVREDHAGLFGLLAVLEDAPERGQAFLDNALKAAWLHEDPRHWPPDDERRRIGLPGLLRGWGIDASGSAGAVLKGWAESRFGLRILHHGRVLADHHQDGRLAADRTARLVHGVLHQLDLLYAFTQQELARRLPGERWLTLWRGSHDPEAYVVREDDRALVEFNAVSSFTGNREIAWEFGSRVWEVRVPLAKILYAPGMLPVLVGEAEYLVLGGDYRVRSLVA